MGARRRPLAARSVALAGIGLAALGMPAGTAGPEPPRQLLPDLDQAVPTGVSAFSRSGEGGRTFHLGFGSAVDNVGAGPLVITGRRSSTAVPEMTAEQRVALSDGSRRTYAGVGTLRFVRSADHSHWHLLRFDRYALHRASDNALARPDRKTGFCLGDRYETDPQRRLQGEPRAPRWTGDCAGGEPGRLQVSEGISVGYGDDYPARLEGQSLDITNVPAGLYYLVHRANLDRRLRESDYTNNDASLLVRLRWPQGFQSPPAITVLRRCPDRRRCPPLTR